MRRSRSAGATPPAYDGSFSIAVTGSNTFTYTMTSTPASNASSASNASMTASYIMYEPITSITYSGTTATVTSLPTTGSLRASRSASPGPTPSAYDGFFTSPC